MKKFLFSLVVFLGAIVLLTGCGKKDVKLETIMEDIDFVQTTDKDIIMPTLGDEYKDVTISFKSSNPKVISLTGKVSQQLTLVEVTMTVTLKRGEEKLEKDFKIQVLPVDVETLLEKALSQVSFAATITENIEWPALPEDDLFKDAKVEYKSDKEAIISNEGVVVRGEKDEEVNITVKITLGDVSKEKVIKVTVLKAEEIGATDEEKVDEVIKALALSEETTVDILLPDEVEGVAITWQSADENVIANDGKVTRPYLQDVTVKLTATFKLGEVSKTKDYEIKVIGYTESDIPVSLTNVSYKIEQEELEKEVNAKLTIEGKLKALPNPETRTIKLTLYYKDDISLEVYDNLATETDGTFKFEIRPNHHGIGWEWYKVKLTLTEDTLVKENILIPYKEEVKALAVLHGQDGEIRWFKTWENDGMLNIKTDNGNISAEQKTDKMKVLADYQRLNLDSTLILKSGYNLPSDTGDWGQHIPIVWQSDSEAITISENKVTVLSDAELGTITLVATITQGEYSIQKEFKAGAAAFKVEYENLTAELINKDEGAGKTSVYLVIKGDVLKAEEGSLYKLEARIDKDDQEVVLGVIENKETTLGKLEFEVPVSTYDFKNEWGKYRLVATVGENESKDDFPEDKTTILGNPKVAVDPISNKAQFYQVDYAWGFLHTKEPDGKMLKEVSSKETLSFRVEDDKVYLEIEGKINNDCGYLFKDIKLVLKGGATFNNLYEGTEVNHYKFSADVTDIPLGDWRDIEIQCNINYLPGKEEYLAPYKREFFLDGAYKDALNEAVAIEHNGFKYYFAAWDNNLKVVRSAIE